VEVDEELGFGDIGLGAASLMLVLEEGEDGFASGEVRVGGGKTVRRASD